MVAISSWGRLGQSQHKVRPLYQSTAVAAEIAEDLPGLAYGMGRSYGDVCLNPEGSLWTTAGLDKFIDFDRERGIIDCQAGVLLRDIQNLVVPEGWMLPVTPGTQFVTVGGAVANDVHGKNHHQFGTFGDHVTQLTLIRTDGEIIACGPAQRPEWFAATVGGLGLTGIITRVSIALRRVHGPWLAVESQPFASLQDFFQMSDEAETQWEYTVSWIDCVARRARRGIFFRAKHARDVAGAQYRERAVSLPFTPPFSMVNRLSLRPFNWAYYNIHRLQSGSRLDHYQPFFYPLDRIRKWNRMYGPRGFYQYQCVVPTECREQAMAELIGETARSNSGSFLAVLKTFGDSKPAGMLSFPMAGATLALDFPNRGDTTLALLSRLDNILSSCGGRLYAAKDARMPAKLFADGYPLLEQFLAFRDAGISSSFSRRILGN